jgi:hypothetical protein
MNPKTPDAPGGSVFADAGAARRAIELALPMIEPTLSDAAICGSGFLSIVVLDPALAPGECEFEDAILAEHDLGERARWDADYAAFARAKARLAWFSGQDGHLVQSLQPHSLRAGDSLLWGGVCLDGIVVGVSGAHAYFDEAFATAIAANLRAIAKQRHAAARERDELVAARPVA